MIKELPHGTLYIDGSYRAASDGGICPVYEKATGAVLGAVAEATRADVEEAVVGAVAAQKQWQATAAPERANILRRAAALLEADRARLTELLVREAGSTREKADGELDSCIEELYQVGALCFEPVGSVLPSGVPGRTNLIERRPVGVVALITAWNYPMDIALRVLAAALALGNAVVLKPATPTPLSGGLVWVELFTRAGLPHGLLQVVPGDIAGPALVAHPNVDMIHFTGSSAVGRSIAIEAAKGLKKVALEMGGNNPAIILADADLEHAVAQAGAATFVHQGQVCVATSRHIVVESVAREYVERLAEYASRLRVGNPAVEDVDLGPLLNERQASRAHGLVQAAVATGARLVVGGQRDGLLFEPTVIDGVRPGMGVFDQELFAPIAPITVAADESDAVRLANATDYGLSASIFTADVERGWALARQIRSGMVHVNEMSALRENHVPFGGVGASGAGQPFGGRANIDLLTEQRWISLRSTRAHDSAQGVEST